jgi:uncharacterized protein (DUF2235 family)
VKQLVICCDGTWNRPDQLSPTNVAKMALAVAPGDGEGAEQRLLYHRGVGTDRFERLRGGAFGLGLSRHVRECYRFVVENYAPGDRLYFFGFSRGAFTARSTVGLIRNAGILLPEHASHITDAYRLYKSRKDERHPNGIESRIFRRMYSHDEVTIHFVGVWDTVGALGIPGLPRAVARVWWGFHDTTLSSYVSSAYQALAIDEQRLPYRPTLWQREDAATEQTVEQVWFTGVHSDVGGGYDDPALAELALLWMVDRARVCGLAFDPDHFRRTTPKPGDEDRRLGLHVAPNALGQLHDSRKGPFRLLPALARKLVRARGTAAARTAIDRRDQLPEYRPRNLADYLDGGGAIAEVQARE